MISGLLASLVIHLDRRNGQWKLSPMPKYVVIICGASGSSSTGRVVADT
jgi:hypothetical protein